MRGLSALAVLAFVLAALLDQPVLVRCDFGGGHHHHHHSPDHDHSHNHAAHDHGHKDREEGPEEVPTKGQLVLPNLKDCKERVHHAKLNGHGYFFSWEHEATKNLTVKWLTGRNICRRHCMDLISLESMEETKFLHLRMAEEGVRFLWTSGRKCNFDGCDRPDLQPAILKGWFWSGTGVKIQVNTNGTGPEGFWSKTGGDGQPQPDNRELRVTGKNDEACLAVMNNFYGDGIVWHDIACYHQKPFVCEDNEELLKFMEESNPGLVLR